MIKAGKKYLDDNHVPYDTDKLFLSGHSEGGYVTVAVQKELEINPVIGLKITASAPSAGPYDVELVGKLIFQNNTYPSPSYLLLILTAYNDYYNWQRPATDFFQIPYSYFAKSLLSGNLNEDEINQELTTNLTMLMDSTFLNNFRDDGETEFKQMLILNSVNNWATKTPTRLYHGTSDNLVPFEISQKTYESFISNGSDTSLVKLVPLPGIGHDYVPAYKLILEWFKTFK
jgi:pimeloyl-ACP methyl ester carboxylesterase